MKELTDQKKNFKLTLEDLSTSINLEIVYTDSDPEYIPDDLLLVRLQDALALGCKIASEN